MLWSSYLLGGMQRIMATRIAYALILLVNSILSWLMLTDWAVKKLQHLVLDYTTISCNGKECYGFVAVHRVNFALGAFHFILAILLLGVKSSRDGRAPIQNGFWGPKIIAWLGLIVVTWLIPDGFFIAWGNYGALVGAILFLLLGLVLLVDLAHTWAEYCLDKINVQETNARAWGILLAGSALFMYLASIAMTIVMYIFFAHSGCSMNQAAITVNLVLLLGISLLSVHPAIQEANPRAGLAQAATVAVYCTYLTLSAVAMEPDDQHCNPLVRARGTRKATIIMGAIVTFLTVAYTTTRAATYGLALGARGGATEYSQLGAEDNEHGLISTQPSSRREMRAEALRAAVESGSLPASALDDSDSDDEDDDGKAPRDDERNATQYNYTLFHIIFLLSTAWVATLLTQNVGGDQSLERGDFVPVGRSYWASWVKIVSAWVCYGIFGWSLVAPAVLPDRFDYQ
ncbi:Membrane protein tms1 [Elasticomyces elasticus]|nr:Membrane protein tms1 [Elasticomyces elasticus]